jgi:hypothetical protein
VQSKLKSKSKNLSLQACCQNHQFSGRLLPIIAGLYRSKLDADERQTIIMANPNHFELEPNHHESIKALAEEIDAPLDEVGQIYASTLEILKTSARIQDYLPLLASKKVRDTLRH